MAGISQRYLAPMRSPPSARPKPIVYRTQVDRLRTLGMQLLLDTWATTARTAIAALNALVLSLLVTSRS